MDQHPQGMEPHPALRWPFDVKLFRRWGDAREEGQGYAEGLAATRGERREAGGRVPVTPPSKPRWDPLNGVVRASSSIRPDPCRVLADVQLPDGMPRHGLAAGENRQLQL